MRASSPIILVLSIVLFLFALPWQKTLASPPAGYTLVWSDEFNTNSLDQNYWFYDYLGAWRSGYNTSDAVSVANGNLTIKTYDDAGKHYSAHISTRGKYHPKYGYFEARIRFANTSGNWSSFYTFIPAAPGATDPRLKGVEMDIVEHRLLDYYGNNINDQIPSTLHWANGTTAEDSTSGLRGSGLGTGYHLYALEWTPTQYNFYIDGAYAWSKTNSANTYPVDPEVPVSHVAEFILLCTEILDAGWCGPIPAGGYGTLATTTTKMDVDYVRVYQQNPVAPATPTNLQFVHSNRTEIQLSWPLCDNAPYYHVKRSLSASGPFTTIATSGVGFKDTTAVEGVTYYYVVSAVNGTAESGDSNVVSAALVMSDAHTGLRAAVGTLTPNTFGALTQFVTVTANTNYQAGFWIKGSGRVRFMVRQAASPYASFVDTMVDATSPVWTHYTANFNSGADTNLRFYIYDYSPSTGTVFVDDAFFGVPNGTNLLTDPSFENGGAGWLISRPETWSYGLVGDMHSGTRSILGFIDPSWTGNVALNQPVNVAAGAAGQAGFWMKGNGKVRFLVIGGASQSNLVSQFISATPTWTYYSSPFNTGSETQVVFRIDVQSTPGQSVFVDDTSLSTGGANLLVNSGFESGTNGWNNTVPYWTPDFY